MLIIHRVFIACLLFVIAVPIEQLQGAAIDAIADGGEPRRNATPILTYLLHALQLRNRANSVIFETENVPHRVPPASGHRLRHSTPILFARAVAPTTATAEEPFGGNATGCPVPPDDDFPPMFDATETRWTVVVYSLIGIYCFTLLAIICDKYFLPCVERFCEVFDISEDVGAATFMSVATSAPEFFVNVIGTFITKSDIGLGTIVGSSMFNTLGVASLGGLFASAPIAIDWCPLTRDVLIYILSITLLVTITWDGKIYWYEGLVLFIAYFVYFIFMFQNKRITRFLYRCVDKPVENKGLISSSGQTSMSGSTNVCEENNNNGGENAVSVNVEAQKETNGGDDCSSWASSCFAKAMKLYTVPIRAILFLTIPDPKKHSQLFPLTFVMCIVWIGTNSYLVSWMITAIGTAFGITDAVLGLTFLAAGGCLPEAISISIMSRRGEGRMGVSNALGANTMNILLSLGMPWFFKTITLGISDYSYIQIDSGSIEYTILALIAVAFCLYVTLLLNKFALSRITGVVLLIMYVVWLVLAILSELVFFERRPCSS